jgi:hypothetical protein
MRASTLQRLGAHLATDENFARKLQKDRRRAIAGVDFLSDEDKHLLGNIDTIPWDNLAAVAQNYQAAAGKSGIIAGVSGGAVHLPDGSVVDLTGGSAPMGWGGIGPPSGPGINVGNGITIGGRRGTGHGSGDGEGGPPDGGVVDYGFGTGALGFGGLPRGAVPGFSDRGIDGNYQPGTPVTLPNQPAANQGTEKYATVGGWWVPVQHDPNIGKVWSDYLDFQASRQSGQAAQLDEPETQAAIDRANGLTPWVEDPFSPEAAGRSKTTPQPVTTVLLKKEETPPPKPDGSNPNLEGTGGTGPGGPRAREAVLSRGWAATPNLEGTSGTTPVGPRAIGAQRGAYGPEGRVAIPNDEGTGNRRPVGPRSRDSSRAIFRGEAMPDPNADGHGGPVGPNS